MNPVHIIGIGQGRQDLTEAHLQRIMSCDILAGGRRQLDMFPDFTGNTLQIKGQLSGIIEEIRESMHTRKIVVLASGDPLFYGIGTTLSRHIPEEHLIVHPNITSVAAAFSAICLPWHDARIISLHSRTDQPFSFASLAGESKVAFLTGPEKDPHYVANQLIKREMDGFRICVLEHLGHPENERISWFTDYQKVLNAAFSHPNIVILLKTGQVDINVPHETFLGMPDTYFRHSRGLITKSEIRSISLSKLRLTRKDHVLWDIGSGSGSVGIEAAFFIPWGTVYTVEKNKDRIPTIVHNIKNFERSNIKVAHLNFPQGHESLKAPDRIFIGGGGKGLEKIITCCCERIAAQGIIVINTVVLESMETAMRTLTDQGFSPEIIQVQVSRSKPMPYGNRLEALNPVWIISGSKPIIHKADTL
ncbi:MAG: precorrin-6y C5,15-methyltransferase (decarboxylating) subunit CbiE [Desulfobacter sp.]